MQINTQDVRSRKTLSTPIFVNSHAGGVRYYERWRMVAVETIKIYFAIFWPFSELTDNDRLFNIRSYILWIQIYHIFISILASSTFKLHFSRVAKKAEYHALEYRKVVTTRMAHFWTSRKKCRLREWHTLVPVLKLAQRHLIELRTSWVTFESGSFWKIKKFHKEGSNSRR